MKKFMGRISAISLIAAPSAQSCGAESLKIGYGAFSLGYALIWVTKEGKLFADLSPKIPVAGTAELKIEST